MSPSRIARDGDVFDQALLRAARHDGPPRGAEERALEGLGFGAAFAARSALAAPPTPILDGRWAGGIKMAAVAAAVGAGLAGSWMAWPRHPIPAPTPATTALCAPALAPAPAPAPALASALAPAAVAPRLHPGPSRAPFPQDTASTSAEVALVQQAARAIAGGEGAVALGVLDTVRRDYPRGVLVEEAAVLRVQALAQVGRGAEATALARRLLDAHPRGLFAARLRSVLAAQEVPGASAR